MVKNRHFHAKKGLKWSKIDSLCVKMGILEGQMVKNGSKWKQATKQASTPPSGAFGTRVVGEALRPAKGRHTARIRRKHGFKWSKIDILNEKTGPKCSKTGQYYQKHGKREST